MRFLTILEINNKKRYQSTSKILYVNGGLNWPNSQRPECSCSISHNAPFRTEMLTFLFSMDHCGIWNRCILGIVYSGHCCVTPPRNMCISLKSGLLHCPLLFFSHINDLPYTTISFSVLFTIAIIVYVCTNMRDRSIHLSSVPKYYCGTAHFSRIETAIMWCNLRLRLTHWPPRDSVVILS